MAILVVGTGAIGQRHASNLSFLGEEVTPFSMRDKGLDALQAELRPDRFEAAILCTATQIRTEVLSLLAGAQLPVYVEKPVAFQTDTLTEIYDMFNAQALRSFVGYMMRYHPAVRWLADADLSDIYRYDFTIGHDVNLWRANWSFKDSYASHPEGGGVLLDLCHELDIAHLVFRGSTIASVTCSDAEGFEGVDFATQIALQSDHAHGTVSMDYLSPVSTRIFRAYGTEQTLTFDFASNVYVRQTKSGLEELNLTIDRQDMFRNAMADFLTLVRGAAPKNPIAPILYKERSSCQFICDAYQKRKFNGKIRS